MDGTTRQVSSSSSFTAQLFGTKESSNSPSSAGIFASMFPPPAMALGRNGSSSKASESWQEMPVEYEAWNIKRGAHVPQVEGGFGIGSNFNLKEERVLTPCHLSSSLYYGGQDICSHSPTAQASGPYPILKKERVEGAHNGDNPQDDASRGNWWQGSLYY